ncbi:MAG: hypothetical protein QXO71_12950 [Candidatus Jordarchaeaceae archaeon]
MIYAVWILKSTGESLLNVAFEKLRLAESDPVLLGGLFSAVSEIAKHNVNELTTITIIVGEMKLTFTFSKNVIVVVAGDTEEEAKRFGKEVENAFNERFGSIFENWNGNIRIFKEFVPEVEKMVQKYGSLESDVEEVLRSLSE